MADFFVRTFLEYPISNKEFPISKVGVFAVSSPTSLIRPAVNQAVEQLFPSSLDIPCWILDIQFPRFRTARDTACGHAPGQ